MLTVNVKGMVGRQIIIIVTLVLCLLSELDALSEDDGGLVPNADSTEEKKELNDLKSKAATKDKSDKAVSEGHLYLPEGYNKFEIPSETESIGLGGDYIIRVHARVRTVDDLNESDEKLTLTLDVRLWWTDWSIFKANQGNVTSSGEGFTFEVRRKRDLAKPKKLDPSFLKLIWKPDLFIENLASTARPEFISKPIKVVYHPDGTLVLESRVTITVGCDMDFHYYPADTQECQVRVRSYSFEDSEMAVEWGSPRPSAYLFDRRNTNFQIQLTEPKIEKFVEPSLDDPVESITIGGVPLELPRKNDSYDVLTFTVKARRRLSYHIFQSYLPSAFFILITWLCFCFPVEMIEARVAIAMTTLLTLTAMFAAVRESTPIVSYVKAIDIWMIVCVIFVFLILTEFAILVWLGLTKPVEENPPEDSRATEPASKAPEAFELSERNGAAVQAMNGNLVQNSGSSRILIQSQELECKNKQESLRHWIERGTMTFLLLLFIAFNVLYWTWLFSASDYFSWEVDPTYNAPVEDE